MVPYYHVNHTNLVTTSPTTADIDTTDHTGHFNTVSKNIRPTSIAASLGILTALIHMGSYRAAVSKPTTEAFTPAKTPRNLSIERRSFQNGITPTIRRNDGRYMADRLINPLTNGYLNCPIDEPK